MQRKDTDIGKIKNALEIIYLVISNTDFLVKTLNILIIMINTIDNIVIIYKDLKTIRQLQSHYATLSTYKKFAKNI